MSNSNLAKHIPATVITNGKMNVVTSNANELMSYAYSMAPAANRKKSKEPCNINAGNKT